MTLKPNLSHMTLVAIQAALKSGTILRQGFGTHYRVIAKPGKQNIVTEYDQASEESIISIIKTHFPDHSILGEESGFSNQTQDSILWLIDPLDGTTNFVRQLPFFTISIAAYHQNEGLCAVILQPMTHELFIAEKGQGAYLNGLKLAVSQTAKIDDAIIGAGFPYNLPQKTRDNLNYLSRFTQMGAILRNLGSAALALAYVAAGKLDGFWMDNLYPWDLAAGKLLIEEAGGKITQYDGTPHQITQPASILATNQFLHAEMLNHLN